MSIETKDTCSEPFSFTQGDDFPFGIAIRDAKGDPVNITGWVFSITLKSVLALTDQEAELKFDSVPTQGTAAKAGNGTILIRRVLTKDISPSEYDFDIQTVYLGKLITVITDKITVLPQVTKRES